jgi:prepilin-type N-terminal cleavage/methylation domain-containing protein
MAFRSISRRSYSRGSAGFTLIELMITVAIVAILATIAYPSYRDYVIRGKIVPATNALSALQANMERFYQDNRQYTDVSATLLSPCDTGNLPTLTDFNVTCITVNNVAATPPVQTFALTAAGIAGGPMAGFSYSVNSSNVLSTAIAAPAPSGWIMACPSSWAMRAKQC